MVEYNLAKVNVGGSSPLFCFFIFKMDPKAVFGISKKYSGIIMYRHFIIQKCDYRLIGKSFIFQVNIMGSSPINHKKYNKLCGIF